ncbi:hypothetical protein F511_43615 [Dorcoceras hygrometricum]|uniref:Uncharacterized protein n=1 Tax=Dorcoceras hygrometricum TaxID=472368 RepID=A0A2Z7C4C1_9LAMI|nr:hypothetical protein F511_43615 [Dorcoceras hygrometricum]
MNIKGEDSSSAGALNAFNEEGDVYYFSKDSTNLVSLISGGFSTADIIVSVESVEAENDGDVMMSIVLLWLTSSNLLNRMMSCRANCLRKLSIVNVACTVPKINTVAKSDVDSDKEYCFKIYRVNLSMHAALFVGRPIHCSRCCWQIHYDTVNKSCWQISSFSILHQ